MHHVALTMELTLPEMKIVSIMAEMPVVPDAGCRDIIEAVQKLEGRFIRPGFTNEVRDLFGKDVGMPASDQSDPGDEFGCRSGIVDLFKPDEGRGCPLPSRNRRFDAYRQLPYVAKRGSLRGKDP